MIITVSCFPFIMNASQETKNKMAIAKDYPFYVDSNDVGQQKMYIPSARNVGVRTYDPETGNKTDQYIPDIHFLINKDKSKNALRLQYISDELSCRNSHGRINVIFLLANSKNEQHFLFDGPNYFGRYNDGRPPDSNIVCAQINDKEQLSTIYCLPSKNKGSMSGEKFVEGHNINDTEKFKIKEIEGFITSISLLKKRNKILCCATKNEQHALHILEEVDHKQKIKKDIAKTISSEEYAQYEHVKRYMMIDGQYVNVYKHGSIGQYIQNGEACEELPEEYIEVFETEAGLNQYVEEYSSYEFQEVMIKKWATVTMDIPISLKKILSMNGQDMYIALSAEGQLYYLDLSQKDDLRISGILQENNIIVKDVSINPYRGRVILIDTEGKIYTAKPDELENLEHIYTLDKKDTELVEKISFNYDNDFYIFLRSEENNELLDGKCLYLSKKNEQSKSFSYQSRPKSKSTLLSWKKYFTHFRILGAGIVIILLGYFAYINKKHIYKIL